tara:strand:+ start:367 stop:696 length:330 start_codon:yes stop_codon:yes gene_type:complete
MNNPLRAEKTIKLGDNEYKARMSLDTIARIEDTLGISILKVGQILTTQDITQKQCNIILTLCIRAGGNDVEEKDIWKLMSEQDLVKTITQVGELFAVALQTEQTSEKKS